MIISAAKKSKLMRRSMKRWRPEFWTSWTPKTCTQSASKTPAASLETTPSCSWCHTKAKTNYRPLQIRVYKARLLVAAPHPSSASPQAVSFPEEPKLLSDFHWASERKKAYTRHPATFFENLLFQPRAAFTQNNTLLNSKNLLILSQLSDLLFWLRTWSSVSLSHFAKLYLLDC